MCTPRGGFVKAQIYLIYLISPIKQMCKLEGERFGNVKKDKNWST